MGEGACSRGRQWRGRLGSTLYTCEKAEVEGQSPQVLPMRLGANRNTFSLGSLSARRCDLDRFFEGVRFLEGVGTSPLPLWESSLSSAARAAFCRRVRADIVLVKRQCVQRRRAQLIGVQELFNVLSRGGC